MGYKLSLLKNYEEKKKESILYNIATIANQEAELKIKVNKLIQELLEELKETIEQLHDREPAVFVGGAACGIVDKRDDFVKVYLHSNKSDIKKAYLTQHKRKFLLKMKLTYKGVKRMQEIKDYMESQAMLCEKNDNISRKLYAEYGVKRGLRDEQGQGVLTGLTNISDIKAFEYRDGQKCPCDGELSYRGYNIRNLVAGSKGKRFIFEEGAYLLLFGELPNDKQLKEFQGKIATCMKLPTNFTRDVIMKAPSADIMGAMTRSILTLGSYDKKKDNLEISNVLRQSMQLIATFPMMAVYAYHAYNHYEKDDSMYIHRPNKELSIAENFLRVLRPDMKYSELEARVLDIALLLHMEHGGGNNSTFTTRVVTSSGSDTYSVIAAAMSSLKGKKHGGANLMVMNMMDDIKAHVNDYSDEEEIASYLSKILCKEAFDHKGLIYGMGHAVYSLSDPREQVFKGFVEQLAKEKGRDKDMFLYNNIEKIAPQLIAEQRQIFKGVSPNVDFYSGFVYEMLNIPRELYTPLFAIARIVGWSAHRLEELITTDKIIRPAYKSLVTPKEYVPREAR